MVSGDARDVRGGITVVAVGGAENISLTEPRDTGGGGGVTGKIGRARDVTAGLGVRPFLRNQSGL